MTPPKLPCLKCRERHIKCDKQKPKCGRCQSRNLQCVPVERKAVFRRGSKDIDLSGDVFAADQTWVNSQPRKWRRIDDKKDTETELGKVTGAGRARVTSPRRATHTQTAAVPAGASAPEGLVRGLSYAGDYRAEESDNAVTQLYRVEAESAIPPQTTADIASLTRFDNLVNAAVDIQAGGQYPSPTSVSRPGGSIQPSHESPRSFHHISPAASAASTHSHQSNSSLPSIATRHPLATVEQSCLLRYFIEELSPWFDHCDPQCHFRQVVPLRAQSSSCGTLLNAIFAVSSRHLSRLPQYKNPDGMVVYHGQLLPDLATSSAVEYMLKCIPGLSSFHDISDSSEQENLMCAAIILRQYEEMEEEMEETGTESKSPEVNYSANPASTTESTASVGGAQGRVNFLAITQTIIHAMISSSSPLHRSSLAIAAYWIAIRQEVYYALTRRRAPCITFTEADWKSATVANMMIMHAGEVTKWCWGERTVEEYERLKAHQQYLIFTYSSHLTPILQKPADRSKGEIFPTVWYTTDAQVTGVQHLEMARIILIAENPHLRNASRTVHRKAEFLVRNIVLKLCGIAVDNVSKQMPALVNAVISILLYGEYFTDQAERHALMEVIERTKDMRAWPLRSGIKRLLRVWREGDDVEI
ncbi:hypothetical protein BDW74DRAFT_175166 [Aspergillus multicolor]|uniref:uncharacterized protein n=1 Tax=Aspergillus multicolor TaxID=41759 RepID=UPI003CCE07FB